MQFLLALSLGLPALHLAEAKSIWSRTPGEYSKFISSALPLGNGRLGAMPLGTYGKEIVNLNVDSLWRGGPFETEDYKGGNPSESKAGSLPDIRKTIFEKGTGNVDPLLGSNEHFGSYQSLGNLTIDIGDPGEVADYQMSLDLDNAVYMSNFTGGDVDFQREAFCSFPDQVCVYHISSSSSLPAITVGLENNAASPEPNVSCKGNAILLDGQTAKDIGMIYHGRAKVVVPGHASDDFCSGSGVEVPKGQSDITIIVGAGTNYDASKGDSANKYSFKGKDPTDNVLNVVEAASGKGYTQLKKDHIADFSAIFKRFELDLPDKNGSADKPTSELISSYTSGGDPFVENLLFDLGRYLFVSSSREGSLPPNLQGLWAESYSPSWSADYHANINLQMNHWTVEQTGLGDQTEPLWAYITKTWMPRGAETAELLYGASKGWVTHNEMNIFGHTAMKDSAGYANYPVANAWMSQHVWDRFDYSQDGTWYKDVGYPIIKGTAQFWLSQLVEDKHFNDGSWVVNPCNSPEHGPTTFGCTHYQQLIWEVFDHIIRGWDASGDTDTSFKTEVSTMLEKIDDGIHIGSWGQIQEWKMDEHEEKTKHRHLSNLNGWYPGYSISGVHGTNETIVDAVRTSLTERGSGADDADTGWGKMWRSACWALLKDTEQSYSTLKLGIQNNFAGNGLSMYSGNEPFQIDANYGLTGAVMSMLVRDVGRASGDTSTQTVILGPAIPGAWAGGSVKGVRLRGGGVVDFDWDGEGVVKSCNADLSSRPGGVPDVAFQVKGGMDMKC